MLYTLSCTPGHSPPPLRPPPADHCCPSDYKSLYCQMTNVFFFKRCNVITRTRCCVSVPASLPPPLPHQPSLVSTPTPSAPPQLPPEDLNEAKFSFSLLCNLIRAVTPVAACEAGGGSPLQTRLLPDCILPSLLPSLPTPPLLLQHARCRAVTSVPGTLHVNA